MSKRTTHFVDLSHPLENGMQIYPGDPEYACHPALTVPKDGFAVKSLSLGTHTGTHIDAPCHSIDGARSIDQIPLDRLVGPVLLVDLRHKKSREKITWDEDLSMHVSKMKEGTILLLHTGWSEHWGTDKYLEHPYLTREAAQKIMDTGIRVVGVDALSPDEVRTDGAAVDFGAHEVILGSDGVIAENLTNLHNLDSDSEYTISMVPLKIGGGDGSPIRCYAWYH